MNASIRSVATWALSAILLLGVHLATPSAANAEPRPRDIYYAFLADGHRYGFQHTTVTRLPDGNFRYALESRILVDLFGTQKQELTERTELVIAPDYTPISVQTETTGPAGKLTATAHVEQRKLHVDLKREAFKTVRTIDLDGTVVFHACLPDWLNESAGKAPTNPRKFRIVESDTFLTWDATAQPQKTADGSSLWNVDLGLEIGQGQMTFGPDGILQSVRMQIPPIRIERCTPLEAHDIQYLTVKGRQVLSFPITKPIARPDRLTSLKVTLQWTGLPRDQLNLEDERQHIADASDNDDKHRVVLDIRPIQPVQQPLKYPIDDSNFAACLADTRFIKPSDDAIRATARQWTQGCTNSLDAARALSKAIGNHLRGGTLVAETLSGPEVLQTRQGKCSEHATLFASLARSLGIPTRIVLGMRMIAGQWMGHMWNEVYVGRWITVDSTVNEVGDSMQLVKLVHSDTVFGTQAARWKLTESLDVSIDDFQTAPVAVDSRYKTGIEAQTYTNVDHACRLTAPSDDWSLEDKSKSGATVIRFKVPDPDVNIHFVVFPLPETIDPVVLVGARKLRFASLYKQFRILKDAEYKTGPVTGRIFVFQRAAGSKDTGTILTTEVLWRSGGSGFLLNLIAEKSAHDKYLSKFTALLNSFQTLPTPPPKP